MSQFAWTFDYEQPMTEVEPRKVCGKCGIEQAIDQYGPDRKNRDGLKSWCKQCNRAQSRLTLLGIAECCARRSPPPDQACEICGRHDVDLHLDHDHECGHFRGWLCPGCNKGIGQLQEDPVLLMAGARYLLSRRLPHS